MKELKTFPMVKNGAVESVKMLAKHAKIYIQNKKIVVKKVSGKPYVNINKNVQLKPCFIETSTNPTAEKLINTLFISHNWGPGK